MIKENIQIIIEDKINQISNRIIKELLEIYELKIEVNKPFCTIVLETIPNDYKFSELRILATVTRLIPQHLYICPNSKYVFVDKIEDVQLNTEELEIDMDEVTDRIFEKVEKIEEDSQIIKIMNENLTEEEVRTLGYENYVKVAIEVLKKVKEKN